jgi:hypothetical protein
MRVERQLVTDLLRSRGNATTAELAARSLPATIDLARDRVLLRQCGIDPDAMAFDLSHAHRNESAPRTAEPTDGRSRPRIDSLGEPGGLGAQGGAPSTDAEVPAMGRDPERDPRGPTHDRKLSDGAQTGSAGVSPASRERSSVDTHPARCPRCALRFSSADAMLDHLSSHLRRATPGPQFAAGPSIMLSAMPAWQVDAALSDLERSLRRPRLTRLARAMLKGGLLSIIVLAAVVFVVAGRPVLGITFAVSAVLLADGRPVRYLRRVSAGRARRPGAE